MFVTDVKCSKATWQTVPNSRTCSSKASVSEAVVRTWHRTHVVKGRPEGPSVAFRDETDIISQVRRHLTTQMSRMSRGYTEASMSQRPGRRLPVWSDVYFLPNLIDYAYAVRQGKREGLGTPCLHESVTRDQSRNHSASVVSTL